MPRTRIKICGIRDEDTLYAASDEGADAVGFMFVESSPRFIRPEAAAELLSLLPPFVSAVGVFANPTMDHFADIEEICPTPFSQLHGQEEGRLVRACGPDVIKAVKYEAGTIADTIAGWEQLDEVGAILVDGSAGGEGVAFEWAALASIIENCSKPIIIAGGLTPQNVGTAIRACRPFGVDVSSGVETSKGVKDAHLIEAFCAAVREADRD